MLAVALARSGEIELSELSARAVLASTPVDAEMLFLLGVACEARDGLDEALDAYEKALEAEPDHWRTLFHLGKLALSIGLQPQARDYFGQVLEINPAHAATARILDKFQEFDELEVQQAKAIGQAETEESDGDLELDGAQLVEVRAYISPRLSVAHAHLPAPHRHTRN